MKSHLFEVQLLTSMFLIGCSSKPHNTVGFYQKTQLHNHVYKYKDCEDKIKHKHGGKRGENIVTKTHKHHLTGSCQSRINQRRNKQRTIDILIKEPPPPQLPSNFKCTSYGVKEGTAECNKLREINAR